VGFEYYATLGSVGALLPWREQEQQVFEVVDVVSIDRVELNLGVGEGLTVASEGVVLKAILGYEFEAAGTLRESVNPLRGCLIKTDASAE
jgi:hypothetical protein